MDYRFSERRSSERFRSLRGLRIRDRSLGTAASDPVVCVDGTVVSDPVSCAPHGGVRPSSPSSSPSSSTPTRLIYTGPIAISPSRVPAIQQIAAIYDRAQKAQIDRAMWTLDQGWVPPNAGTKFNDARICVRQPNFAGSVVVTKWSDLSSPNDCRNADGRVFSQPNCQWGYWEITPCNMNTATQFMFQMQRYLWAQSRLRDMLASRPVKGVTSAQDAADWAWLVFQYVSALLWSTNVRIFDEHVTEGMYLDPDDQIDWPVGTAPNGLTLYPIVYGYTPPFVFNQAQGIGDGPIPYHPVPIYQSDFSPGVYSLMSRDTWAEQIAARDQARLPELHAPGVRGTVPRGFSPWNPYASSTTPVGLSDEQRGQIRSEANAILATYGDVAARWAEARAFHNWTFRATWGWADKWRMFPNTISLTDRRGVARTYQLMVGGADVIVDVATKLAQHYADRNLIYTGWMQAAIIGYDVQIAALSLPTNVRVDWARARDQLSAQLSSAATTERDSITGNQGIAMLGIASSLLTLFGGYVAIVGYLFQAVSQLATAIFQWVGGLITARQACPTMPFLRITTGDCDLSESTITSSLLGVDSNAAWPLNGSAIAGKTIVFMVDGAQVPVTFQASDTTADAVARRINAAAALALPAGHATVANVVGGQVHVQGSDASTQVRVIGGTAVSLRFPGPLSDVPPPPPPASGGGGLLLALAAAAAGLYVWSSSKKNATMREP